MRADIVPGAVFPDYELSHHRGSHRKLSELQGGDPLVLVLSRGGGCGSAACLGVIDRFVRCLEKRLLVLRMIGQESDADTY